MSLPHFAADPAITQVLLATTNLAKEGTFRWLLEGLPLHPVAPRELGLSSTAEEAGDTHEAIARRKAQDWSLAGSMLALASDGGLVIPALGDGWESRFTHRFAGPAASDQDRLQRLLELMRPHQGAARQAWWLEALALADRGEVLASWELTSGAGAIAESASAGSQVEGFWAFEVWCFPQLGKTYNQLSTQERAAVGDHWTRLRELVRRFFQGYLGQPGR